MTPPPARLDFTYSFAADGTQAKVRPAAGVGHVVFIAPYSGAAKSPTASKLAARPLVLGEAFRIVPSAILIEPLTPWSEPFLLRFADADSLHPDSLLDTVPSLKELWEPLRDLDHDASAADRLALMVAHSEAVVWGANPGPESKGPSDGEANAKASVALETPEAADDLLDRLLGQRSAQARRADATQGGSASIAAAQALVQQFAERVLSEEAPSRRSGASQVSSNLRMKAEAELGRRLRALLRQQAFQSLAGSWLATEMVVRSCPDDSRARFSALDATWLELVSRPMEFADLINSGASVVVVDHCFGTEPAELSGLVALVRACHEQSVFFVAGAAPSLAGLEDRFLKDPAGTKHDVEAWQRDWSDEAREAWVQLGSLRERGAQFALTLPRCLVRHPYGKLGEPLEKIEFEELDDHPEAVHFLWANGAYLVARALMEQWCGHEPQSDGSYEVGGLPVVTVPDIDGRRALQPVELALPRSAVEQLMDQGFSVVEARRDSDRARVYV